jgi:hypothetical protein
LKQRHNITRPGAATPIEREVFDRRSRVCSGCVLASDILLGRVVRALGPRMTLCQRCKTMTSMLVVQSGFIAEPVAEVEKVPAVADVEAKVPCARRRRNITVPWRDRARS